MENQRMPVLFMGHGSPMNAIEENEFSLVWQELGRSLPKPKAMLCISAHWETPFPQVTAMTSPKTIHDFYGFPMELSEMEYPAPGSPQLAERVISLLAKRSSEKNYDWGLDHGTWSVLSRMYPQADIPVVQLSLPQIRDGQFHFDIGSQLLPLRDEGVLIIGSGNLVHNLRLINVEGKPYDWAVEFDARMKKWIEEAGKDSMIKYQDQGTAAVQSINSAEHYLPFLYILALRQPNDDVRFYCEKIVLGSISMRCVQFG